MQEGRAVRTFPWELQDVSITINGKDTRDPLSKNLMPAFSTNSRNPGPHPNRSAQTSMIAIGFLACLKRAVISLMTWERTGLLSRVFSSEEGRGGAECG